MNIIELAGKRYQIRKTADGERQVKTEHGWINSGRMFDYLLNKGQTKAIEDLYNSGHKQLTDIQQ